MNQENDFIDVDDTECIKYILEILPQEMQDKISDDDVQYILDLICEYYAENDLVDSNAEDEASIAEEDMFNFIMAAIKKEKIINLSGKMVEAILEGEFQYGKKIGIYTEEEQQ